jgi:catechol 2,3-dioxygenase-like lactoylglutathione lyase family enzyme
VSRKVGFLVTEAPVQCLCAPSTLLSCKFPIRTGTKRFQRIARRIVRRFLVLLLFSPMLASAQSEGRPDTLPAPGFHHLHLNSTNPDAAIDFYTKQFPSTTKTSFAGFPALRAGKVYVLFTKVSAPPPTEPQTAIWHFGWHVVDVRKNLAMYRQRNLQLLPLYTSDEGGTVFVSSDTWPGTAGVLGLTKPQIVEAKATGVQPRGGAGFAYLSGPDGAVVEYQGDMPAERFNHVHMYQEDPFCARLWYQKHLNASVSQVGAGQGPQTAIDCKAERGGRSWPSLEREGTIRQPASGVSFDDVALYWYARQGDRPLVSTRGHVADHIALSVINLDAWIAKLREEGVTFLEQPYKFGDTRAVMIEGPSHEAVELVEVK